MRNNNFNMNLTENVDNKCAFLKQKQTYQFAFLTLMFCDLDSSIFTFGDVHYCITGCRHKIENRMTKSTDPDETTRQYWSGWRRL